VEHKEINRTICDDGREIFISFADRPNTAVINQNKADFAVTPPCLYIQLQTAL
jgi:hypothetical protein